MMYLRSRGSPGRLRRPDRGHALLNCRSILEGSGYAALASHQITVSKSRPEFAP